MKWLRHKIISILAHKLFKIIREEDVLRMDSNGYIIYRGNRMSKSDSMRIRKDAKELLNSFVLESILSDMDYFACKKIYFDSGSKEDVSQNQMLLYYNNVLREKLLKLSSLKIK